MEKLKMKDGSVRYYTPKIAFKCIYCGRLATMVEFIREVDSEDQLDHSPEDRTWGLMHEGPECPEFIAMDPLIFTKNNREKFERDMEEKGNN